MISPLPEPLGRVPLLDRISPSSLGKLDLCHLQMLRRRPRIEEDWVLLPPPSACWGTFAHGVIERAHRKEGEGNDWARLRIEEALRSEAGQAVQRVLPYDELAHRVAELLGWLKGLAPRVANASSGERIPGVGLEVSLKSDRLPLAGRADMVSRTGPNHFVVTDFKSGQVKGEDGQVHASIQLQLMAYAFMVREAHPGATLELRVSTPRESIQFPYDPERAPRLLETEIRRVLGDRALGGEAEAGSLAKPSSACVYCRLRPACGTYRETMPHWLDQAMPHRLPPDAVGRPEPRALSRMGSYLNLRDPAGRIRSLRNPPPDLPSVGDVPIWAFDLWIRGSQRKGEGWEYPSVLFAGPPYPNGMKMGIAKFMVEG